MLLVEPGEHLAEFDLEVEFSRTGLIRFGGFTLGTASAMI